jgi:hypothetical protein
VTRKVWTAAELEQLSPAERQRIFDESLVTDLSQVPPDFLARIRDEVRQHIAEHETNDAG